MVRQVDDRRWKVIFISPNMILALFQKPLYEIFSYTIFKNLPEDYIIDQIDYDLQYQAFRFLIYSPEFEVVPEYMYPPRIDIEFKTLFLREEK